MGMFDSATSFLSAGAINPKTPDFAGAAASAERRRQALINAGLQSINAVFQGGTAPMYTPYTDKVPKNGAKALAGQEFFTYNKKGEFVPYQVPGVGQQKSLSDKLISNTIASAPFNPGSVWQSPVTFLSSIFGGGGPSIRDMVNSKIRAGKLFTAQNKTYEGFGDNFYNGVAKDYINYALPQLSDQYTAARDSIMFGLQNRGLQNSSSQDKAMSDLTITTGRQEQQIADNARAAANELRQSVERARQEAINQLYQTADPAGALQGAVSTASQFKVPQTFTPILNTFSQLANQYAMSQLFNNFTPAMYANPQLRGASNILGPTTY